MSNTIIHTREKDVSRDIHVSSIDNEDEITVVTTQEVGPIVDEVKRLRAHNAQIGTQRQHGALTPVAEIPMVVYEQAVREGWADDPAAWRKWANDPQNEPLRITKGRF